MKPKLILIRGIPGSGKSTFARFIQSMNPSYLVYEADQFFTQIDGTYKYDPSRIKEAHEWCQEQTFQALDSGVSVIVANTFIKKWEMAPYLAHAATLNITPTILIMNQQFKSIHDVPSAKIEQMKRNFGF